MDRVQLLINTYPLGASSTCCLYDLILRSSQPSPSDHIREHFSYDLEIALEQLEGLSPALQSPSVFPHQLPS